MLSRVALVARARVAICTARQPGICGPRSRQGVRCESSSSEPLLLRVSLGSVSAFARTHAALLTATGTALSAVVLTVYILRGKDVALERVRGEMNVALKEKDVTMERMRRETGVALEHTRVDVERLRGELGVAVARAEGRTDAKLLDLYAHSDYDGMRVLLEAKQRSAAAAVTGAPR